MSSATPAPSVAIRGTSAIRTGIALLGAIGFGLSYDALRQMAVAIHIRGPLTYAFPLVIDGFIAIGVAALLLLRTAPLHSRLYVWALVGIATATSIWANALHAIRLNQQTPHDGLHLDNMTVGALSAIAPLALAGAIHLYLVIRRHTPTTAGAAHRHNNTGHTATSNNVRDTAPRQPAAPAAGELDPAQAESQPTANVAEPGAANAADGPEPSVKSKGRQPSATLDELLAIGRTAPLGRNGLISRRAIEAAIRAKGHTIGKDRLTHIKDRLQMERVNNDGGTTG